MIENIVIRGAVTEEERSLFWERLRAYFCLILCIIIIEMTVGNPHFEAG